MKKVLLYGVFMLLAASLMANSERSINGVDLYKNGSFPQGKLLDVDGLASLPTGKWQQPIYLAEPIEFKDNGVMDRRGCQEYIGKVNHTWVGGLYVKMTNSAASTSLFKIKFPYQTPLKSGGSYKFTTAAPLTIISKETRLNSDGRRFSVYNCVYQGYLKVRGTTYPID